MRIQIHITGLTPIIMNKFSDAQALIASSGSRGSSAAQDRGTPLEIAQSKVYLGLDGEPMIPQPNLLRCLVEGGKYTKVGRAQITTRESSMLYSCLDIAGTEIKLYHSQPWKVDSRPIVIPSTKGRILAHRPMFDDWELRFECELDTTIIGVKLFRQIVDDAGKRIGLGDFRPSRKGPYGRFVVTFWEEQIVELAEAAE